MFDPVTPRRDDRGLGLVEMIVAIAILSVVFAALAGVAVTAFRSLAQDRETQAATQLGVQTMERVRALAFNTLRVGIPTTQLDDAIAEGIPGISKSGTQYLFRGEEILTTADASPDTSLTAGTPLNPFRPAPVTLDITSYSVTTIPTCFESVATATPACPSEGSPTIRVTVSVQWSSLNGNARTIESESLFYSPSSCLSPDTHPYSSPCQAFFYGSATLGGGAITITSGDESGQLIGSDEASMALTFPTTTSTLAVEQVASAIGTATPAGVALTSLSGASLPFSDVPAGAAVSTDPADGGATTDSSTRAWTSQSPSVVSHDGVTLTPALGTGTGNAAAVTAASASGTVTCPNASGVAVSSDKPCGSSNGTFSGASTITLGGSKDGLTLTTTMASVGTTGTPQRAYSTLFTSSGGAVCSGATADLGCAVAQAAGPLPTVQFGGIPAGLSPPTAMTNGLFSVSGASVSATAQQLGGANGGAAGAPTLGSPVLTYWDGTGYSTVSLTPTSTTAGNPISLPFSTATPYAYPSAGAANRVEVRPALKYGSLPTGTVPATGSTCAPGTPCTSTSAATSILTGSVQIQVFAGGDEVVNLILTVDVKGVTAKATYQAAPVAN